MYKFEMKRKKEKKVHNLFKLNENHKKTVFSIIHHSMKSSSLYTTQFLLFLFFSFLKEFEYKLHTLESSKRNGIKKIKKANKLNHLF